MYCAFLLYATKTNHPSLLLQRRMMLKGGEHGTRPRLYQYAVPVQAAFLTEKIMIETLPPVQQRKCVKLQHGKRIMAYYRNMMNTARYLQEHACKCMRVCSRMTIRCPITFKKIILYPYISSIFNNSKLHWRMTVMIGIFSAWQHDTYISINSNVGADENHYYNKVPWNRIINIFGRSHINRNILHAATFYTT